MHGFATELRFALRQLTRAPGFTAVVILTLALGIGATTAIFSFVNGVLLRPLPYPQPDRVVMLCETNPERDSDWCGASPTNSADWARLSQTLDSTGLARSWPFGVMQEGKVKGVSGGIATPGVFQVFRVQPAMGRVLQPQDILPGNEHVALVSHQFWKSSLGGAQDVLDRTLDIDGENYRIVGVLPAKFEMPWLGFVEVWIPLWPERLGMREWRGFYSYGRLKPGVSLEQARAEMGTIRDQLAAEYPETNKAWGVAVYSLLDWTVRDVRQALLLFQIAVFLVLLIACANVANLFLARGSSREREFAVRLALGAGRPRLVRHLLVESLLYAVAGGALGVLLAVWARDFFSQLAPTWFPRLEEVRLDGGVLAFAVAVTMLATVLLGLVPALHASDVNVNEALREGRTGGDRRSGSRLRDALVVSEIALACLLLVAAGLLARSFWNLLDWRPGFDRQNLIIAQVFSSSGKYPKVGPVVDLYRRGVEELRALPGVVSAGAGSAVPLYGGDGEQEFQIEGRPALPPGERPSVAWFDVDPHYFQTLGVPLLRGRFFSDADTRGAPQVAIINDTLARRYWPNENPIGQRVRLELHRETFEIVGVVGDVHPFNPDKAPEPQIFWPFAQVPRWAICFIVRTTARPEAAISAVHNRLEQLDPDMDIGRIRTMDERVDAQLVEPRFNLSLLGIFAGFAMAIAAAGIYGVMSFSVARRTHEFGVRIALGAQRRDILGLVFRKGLTLAVVGLTLGLLGAYQLTHLLQSLLVQVGPKDPWTFAGIAVLLLVIALVASYVPARHAMRVDPMTALRHE